jgi:hypothetical protein
MGREFEEWGDAMLSFSVTGEGEINVGYSTAEPGTLVLIFHRRLSVEGGNLCFQCRFETGHLANCVLSYHVLLALYNFREIKRFCLKEENAQRGTKW